MTCAAGQMIPTSGSFIETRLRLFAKIRGENGQMISQAADHSSLREEAAEYATQYIELLSRALRRAEVAASDEQPQTIADLQKLLAVDSVHVDLGESPRRTSVSHPRRSNASFASSVAEHMDVPRELLVAARCRSAETIRWRRLGTRYWIG